MKYYLLDCNYYYRNNLKNQNLLVQYYKNYYFCPLKFGFDHILFGFYFVYFD